MKNTRSRMFISLLVITCTLSVPKMGHAGERTINNLFAGIVLASITNFAEKHIIESNRARKAENRLLHRGYCAAGFAHCIIRNAIGIIASNYACKTIAEVADSTIGNENQFDTIHTFSVASAISIGIYRHLTPYENDNNFSGLRAGCESYWQKWNNKIVADQKAWDRRKRID